MKTEKQVSEEAQAVLVLIAKVTSNSKDASYTKKQVDLYKPKSQELIDELVSLGYEIQSFQPTEKITTPPDGVYHIVLWK